MSKRTKAEIFNICADYEAAFEKANPGQSIRVHATKPGWYRLVKLGGITSARRSYRISQIELMCEHLKTRMTVQAA
jgi:hypothetical protein